MTSTVGAFLSACSFPLVPCSLGCGTWAFRDCARAILCANAQRRLVQTWAGGGEKGRVRARGGSLQLRNGPNRVLGGGLGEEHDFRRAYPPGTDFGELIKNLPDEPVAPPVGEPDGGDGPQPSGGPDDEPRPTGMSRTLKFMLGVAGGAALAAAAYVWSRRGRAGSGGGEVELVTARACTCLLAAPASTATPPHSFSFGSPH